MSQRAGGRARRGCSGLGRVRTEPHRYVFALYATDAPLGLDAGASPDDVRSALSERAIGDGRLTAYGRR